MMALSGDFHSSVALAEIAAAHKYGIPRVGTDVWAEEITAKQYPEVSRVSPANLQNMPRITAAARLWLAASRIPPGVVRGMSGLSRIHICHWRRSSQCNPARPFSFGGRLRCKSKSQLPTVVLG